MLLVPNTQPQYVNNLLRGRLCEIFILPTKKWSWSLFKWLTYKKNIIFHIALQDTLNGKNKGDTKSFL